MNATVTALLVSHDGARWLPQVLDRLAEQTVQPQRVVAVDTGSTDSSVAALRAGLPKGAVLLSEEPIAYPAAVRAGLAALEPGGDEHWVWLLHDDSAPAPDALERLLAATGGHTAAAGRSGPDVLGPKLREWPSLRRLLEVGVTVTGTGRRETGLERGEHDQGQHAEPRDVLAVNTAGMLVRRSVVEGLGFDDELPVLFTDVDFGWRAVRAGHRVCTVPDAVVFHVEAARSGARTVAQRPAVRRRLEREAALYTVLANCATSALPFVAVRLMLGTMLRALALLLVRAPAESRGELAAAAATLVHPGRLVRARKRRRAAARVPPSAVRPLLAPWWLPYRNGLDEVGAVAAAMLTEIAARTRPPGEGTWLGRRRGRGPLVWVLAGLSLVSAVAARELFGDGRLAGGALLPAPASAAHWWHTYLSTTHEVATGSTITAPAYLLPLAVLGTVLLGSSSVALALVVLGAVPLAGVGAFLLLRRLSVGPVTSAWGATSYALVPVIGGALTQGRIGTLVAAALLPWLARTALGLAAGSADRRRRAAWRTTLWLSLAAAFAPLTWVLAVVVTLLGTLLGLATGRLSLGRAALGTVPVLAASVLLLPWSALVWRDRGWASLVTEAGLPASWLVGPVGAADLLAARASHTSTAPVWVGLLTALLAVVALLRTRTRPRVTGCWLVALAGLGLAWALNGVQVADPVGGGGARVWAGVPMLVAHGGWLAAAAIAASGLRESLSTRALGWRQLLGLLVAVVALALPVCGATWWLVHGSDEPLERRADVAVPAYLDAAAQRDPALGTLVLRGGLDEGVSAELRRGVPLTLGQEAVLPSAGEQATLTRVVGDLLAAPEPSTPASLARAGVGYVFVPPPVDPDLAAALDAVPALAGASADDPLARAWRVDTPGAAPRAPEVDPGAREWLRPILLGGQALALLAVVVLALPTRAGRS